MPKTLRDSCHIVYGPGLTERERYVDELVSFSPAQSFGRYCALLTELALGLS